jgi:hypothetical protein
MTNRSLSIHSVAAYCVGDPQKMTPLGHSELLGVLVQEV